MNLHAKDSLWREQFKMHKVELNEPISGFQKHMGYELVEWSNGVAKLMMPLGPHLLNREGIPHGGALATVLDTAMGFAGSYTGDPDNPNIVMTLNLFVNYMAKVSGDCLITTAKVTGGGHKTFFAEASVSDDLGTVAATATGVFKRKI
jgi:uncharacterized protein (TIGR00369 family)